MASAAVMKMAAAVACVRHSAIATGTSSSSQFSSALPVLRGNHRQNTAKLPLLSMRGFYRRSGDCRTSQGAGQKSTVWNQVSRSWLCCASNDLLRQHPDARLPVIGERHLSGTRTTKPEVLYIARLLRFRPGLLLHFRFRHMFHDEELAFPQINQRGGTGGIRALGNHRETSTLH